MPPCLAVRDSYIMVLVCSVHTYTSRVMQLPRRHFVGRHVWPWLAWLAGLVGLGLAGLAGLGWLAGLAGLAGWLAWLA